MTRRAVIVDVVRSPFGRGREDGALAGLHPVDLYAQVLQGLLKRSQLDPALVEDVITGCVIQVAEQAGNIGRQAVLAAGFPESVPAVTLDRKCGSTQQAMDFAAQGVIAGAYDIAIAGGVEMMGLVPMRVNRMGKDSEGPGFHARYPQGTVHQGVAAERVAAHWHLSRLEQDTYSARSHALAQADRAAVARDIISISVPQIDGTRRTVATDEGLRPGTTVEKLGSLRCAFQDETVAARFPEIRWSVTAGNASQVSDGATAMLIMEEATAHRLHLTPRAAITNFAVMGDDPMLLLTAIMPATRKLLARAGITIAQVAAYEVNEAFASVPLAWQKEFDADPAQLNKFGGAIALGHPVGASGGRLTANLLRALEASGGRYGLQTMCEAGGMANATLLERL